MERVECHICLTKVVRNKIKRHLETHINGRKRAPRGKGAHDKKHQCPHCSRFMRFGRLQIHILKDHKPHGKQDLKKKDVRPPKINCASAKVIRTVISSSTASVSEVELPDIQIKLSKYRIGCLIH